MRLLVFLHDDLRGFDNFLRSLCLCFDLFEERPPKPRVLLMVILFFFLQRFLQDISFFFRASVFLCSFGVLAVTELILVGAVIVHFDFGFELATQLYALPADCPQKENLKSELRREWFSTICGGNLSKVYPLPISTHRKDS